MAAQLITRRALVRGAVAVAAAGSVTSLAGCSAAEPIQLPTFSSSPHADGRRVLVAYATAAGSTAETALIIGRTLSEMGLDVDVRPVSARPRVEAYRAVVLGSAVHYGKWLPEAVAFAQANEHALARVPLAVFCVHIQNRGNDEKSRLKREAYLDTVRPHLLQQPVAEGFLPGRFDKRGARILLGAWLAWMVPTVDHMDPVRTRAWAADLKPRLAA